MHIVQTFQMTSNQLNDRLGDGVGIGRIDILSHERQRFRKYPPSMGIAVLIILGCSRCVNEKAPRDRPRS